MLRLRQAVKLGFSTLSNEPPRVTSAAVTDLLQTPEGVNQGTLQASTNASALVLFLVLDSGSPQPSADEVFGPLAVCVPYKRIPQQAVGVCYGMSYASILKLLMCTRAAWGHGCFWGH